MINLFEILQNDSNYNKCVMYCYMATEVENDPVEHTKDITYLNPIPIRVIGKDVSLSSLKWNYAGQIATGSKEILCEIPYENLLKACRKIVIDGEEYKVYKDAQTGFGILKRKDYIIAVLEKQP